MSSAIVEFYINDKERKKVIKKLTKHFTAKVANTIENGIYDFTEQYCRSNQNNTPLAQNIYSDTASNIIYNCETPNNTMDKIKTKITKKQFNPYNLAFLTPDELNRDNWMRIILRRDTTEDKLKNLPTIEWRPCRTCTKTEFFYYQLQTRSADEPVTTFYCCKNCNRTYRCNN